MRVFVFGGGGDVGEHILRQLAERGHESVTMAETQNRAEELRMLGASEVVVTKEKEFSGVLKGCEAIVYIAGANPIAGENKNILVDHQAVIRSVEAAQQENIRRFIYVSPVHPDESDESKETGGKEQPEELVKRSGFIYTVIRPSNSVSKPGKGNIAISPADSGIDDEIPYEDVAAVVVEALESQEAFNQSFGIAAGETPIKEAFRSLQ